LFKYIPYNILKYQLYIFQLEEYDIKIFIKAIFKKGFFANNNLRKDLVWTSKAKLLFSISLFLQLFISLTLSYLIKVYLLNMIAFIIFFVFIYYLSTIFSFIFLASSSKLINPIETLIKNNIINNAKNKLKKFQKLKVIGITGSYGKTTMKEVLFTILSEKYIVIKTEGNNNTPLGIAKTIISNINEDTEILIVEMGEYYVGDIKQLCSITPPDISIITGINEAHLEKYNSMDNAINTKFEIIEYSKKDAFYLLNSDDSLIMKNFERYSSKDKVNFYSSNINNSNIKNYIFYQDGSGQSFDMDNIGKIKVTFLAEYIIGYISASSIVAYHLGMKSTEIRFAISKLKEVNHRLQPRLNSNNILIIDDTYNGNSTGIEEGIKLLGKFKNRRKIYMTPGLVETGSLVKKIHYAIGKSLSKTADKVILIKNSVTNYIFQGLVDNKFNEDNIIWFDNSKEALNKLFSYLQPNDVVLMQNDWTDNYV